jgi:hypothetical protein
MCSGKLKRILEAEGQYSNAPDFEPYFDISSNCHKGVRLSKERQNTKTVSRLSRSTAAATFRISLISSTSHNFHQSINVKSPLHLFFPILFFPLGF